MRYIALETETGGKDPDKHSLLTVSAYVLDHDGELLDFIYIELKHEDYCIDYKEMRDSPLNLEDHDERALVLVEAKHTFAKFLSENIETYENKLVPVGTNLKNDLDFINRQLLSLKSFLQPTGIDVLSIGNFLKMAEKLPSHLNSAQDFANFFDIPRKGARNPERDVDLCIGILRKMLKLVKR